MARLLRAAILIICFLYAGSAFAAGGTCPSSANYLNAAGQPVTLAILGVTNCYYIAANGSDSNSGTSESSPWAHAPGMYGCSSNCAAVTPAAGMGFIFRGGDTWIITSSWAWAWAGSSGSPIYIGVDPTWYSGSSWARPILNGNGAGISGQQFIKVLNSSMTPYVTFDDFEETGWQQSGGTGPINFYYGPHIEWSRFYVHGWSRAVGETSSAGTAIFDCYTADPTNGGSACAGTSVHDTVMDGSDTTRDMGQGLLNVDHFYNNVCNYLVVCAHGSINDAHSNLIMNVVYSWSGDHCDGLFMFNALTGTNQYMYNNVVAGPTVSGCVMLWIATTIGTNTCPSCIGYAFNNVGFNDTNASVGGITLGSHSPPVGSSSIGTFYVYNNTLHGVSGFCFGNTDNSDPTKSITYYSNNHCIAATNICGTGGTTCVNQGTNLSQTEAQANAAGYTLTQQYAYSPTSGIAPAVGAGNNYTSLCSTLPSLCYDIAYPSYDQTNHVVVMRTVNHRPERGAWDIGAYQFSSSASPQAPTNLSTVVQ